MPKLILLLGLTVFVFCKKEKKDSGATVTSRPAAAPLEVQAMIALPQSLSANIEVPGTIIAYESTEIHPEISGRIIHLNVREGSNVSQGTLLAKIYDGDLQAQMRKIDVQLKIAEQTEKREAELLKIQGISQQEYDLSLLQVNNLKADKDIIRESIRKTEIRAPFSGRLGLKGVSQGAFVNPATVITTVSQVNRLKIEFNVPERYGPKLINGLPVSFTVEGSTMTYKANVLATEVMIDEDTRSLAVRATINHPDKSLIPGTFAKVRITLGENTKALLIPNNAILPIGRKKQTFLYKSGKAIATDITTGVRDSTNIEVITGLTQGDTVITSAILFLRPGIDVRIDTIVNREP
jgi:membrane fusion protein (multidrug efflux system)